MRRSLHKLARSNSGAVAPIVALSLVGLIACGGIAFDFAQLAAMDTELQNAADQAALAAASQLDGEEGAIDRAQAAASSLLTNRTLFANDSGGQAIAGLSFTFYTSYDALADTYGSATTTDALAKVVRVTVGSRTVNYALTPIVAAFSGTLGAEAVAGLGTAVCKVPPLMICNPNPAGDPNFNQNYAGRGFLLVGRNSNTDTYGPGNFGFLDSGYDTSGGASTLRRALGQANFAQECLRGDTVVTEPGASSPALDAANTRFDIYSNNTQNNNLCGNGQCPPSANVRKDLMRDAPNSGGGTIKNFCKPSNEDTGQKGWKLMPATGRYLPSTNAPLTSAQRDALSPMGHPRDICHAVSVTGSCAGGRLGDGVWDRDAYFKSNYNWDNATWRTNTGLGSTPSRYQVYMWELDNYKNQQPAGISRPPVTPKGEPNNGGKLHATPVCQPTGAVTPTGDIDRRRLTVAVVNCTGANAASGKKTLAPTKWIDIFLVEPSWNRTDAAGNSRTTANDLYIEVIGESKITGPGGQTFQVERSVPYLIR